MEPNNNKQLALVEESDLSLVENKSLNTNQIQLLLRRTPEHFVKKRPAKGGGTWDYVSGGYVKKILNLMFGWDWDFEILEQMALHGEAIVKGKLTCRTNGHSIVKMQFGNKDIVYKKQSDDEIKKGSEKIPLSIGNDFKSAATDCLKKCAAEIGIAADIYNKADFTEVKIDTTKITVEELSELYELKKESLSPIDIEAIERIINNKETKSYLKIFKKLQKL
jgi:hypothetical protein